MARRIGLALLVALALVFLLIAAVLGLAQTGFGKRLITSQLSTLLTTPEMTVEVTGLQGTVPIDMRLGNVSVADSDGVWLEVDDARLAWSPGALLGGRIRIDRLSAARVGLERLPPSQPSTEPAEPIRMPELPTWLPPTTLQQLSVDKLDLGRNVLGEPASFALTGRLDMPDDGERAELALDLERTDQATASATVDAALQLEPPALDLTMQAQENGGLLAALTGDAEAKGLDLKLVGKGSLDAWKGELHADAKGLARADAMLGIALGEQLELTVEGEMVPAEGVLPADVAAALGDRVRLALAVVQTGPQQLKIERLRATARSTELTADGTVDLESEKFRAGVRLALSDLAALSGLAGTPTAGAIHLDLTADGGFLQPKGRLELQGTDLAVAGVAADRLETSFDFAAGEPLTSGLRGLSLSGSGQTEGLSAPDLAPLPLDDLSWQVAVVAPEEDRIELDRLRLSMADIELTAHGQANPETLAATGQVDLTVGSLARLAEPFGQPVDGGVALHADLASSDQGRQIEAKLNGRIDRLAGLPPGAAELLGETIDLATNVTLQPDSRLQVEDLAIEGAAASLRGDLALSLPEQGLDGKLTLSLPRLAVLQPLLGQPISGALDLDATLAGSVPEPDLQLAARGQDLLLADRPIEKLALLATARGPTSDPAGKVELTVQASGIEATLSTLYQLQDQTLKLTDVALAAPRARIDGAFSIDLERTLIDGTMRGRVQDLAGLAPLLPMPLQGAVDLDASLRPEGARQDVQLSLAVRDLAGDFGRLGRLEASAKIADALGARNLAANASARDFRQNDVQVAELGLDVAGTPEQLNLRSTVKGEAALPFDLEARADVSLGDVLRVRLQELSGHVAGKPLRLAKAAEATVGGQELRLSGLDLRLAGASLSADASMAGGQVTADAALRDLSLAVLADFGAPKLIGDAAARLQMRGAVGDPQATLDLTVAGLRAADPAFGDLPPAQLTAAAKLASRRLSLDVRGEGVTDKPLVVSVELPAVLQLEPFRFEMPDGPMTGRLDAEVQLARLADVAGVDDDRVEGLLTAALRVAGTVQKPQLNGTVDIADGIYENGLTGTVLHDLTLHATARQQRVTIESLAANDGGTGRLSGQGSVDIDPETSFPLDVRLSLRNARLIQTNEATATISGDLKLDGDAKAAKLLGKLTVDGAEIQLPDQVGPSVPTIEVEEVGLGSNDAQSSGASAGTPFDLGLDVVVEVPGRVFVRGRGLESEWEGRIAAKGTASDPRLSGTLQIRRGYFDLLDRRFNLRRGVITFAGQSPPNPQIDIEAVAQAVDITAIVRIGGDATKPTLALDSEPPLPQDEVLSRLLFNRAASGITPVQAIQLAAAVNRLRGGGPGVLDRLRGALGVDTLDVGGGGEGDQGTTVRAGKYVANGVYVEGQTGTADQSSRARVEVEILPNLSLQADTGADANSGVGLKWKFDY